MGKGALPDDHPLILGHDRVLGHEVHQRQDAAAPTGSWRSARASPRPTAARGRTKYTFRIPADEADPHRHRPGRDRPQLSGRDRRGGRPQGGAEGAEPRRAQARAQGRASATKLVAEMAGQPEEVRRRQPEGAGRATPWPMRPERILADLRDVLPRDAHPVHRRGLEQERRRRSSSRSTRRAAIFTPGGFATMGFGSPAALGAKVALPDRVVVALIGDGGFGQNPAALATAFEEDIAVVWVIMNNHAFGTIAGLEAAHYGTTFATVFEKDGKTWSPDYAAIARAYGVDGVKVGSAAEFKPALEKAIKSKRPVRPRRVHEERAGAHRRPLEHHGHLLAGQEGAPREHRRLTPASRSRDRLDRAAATVRRRAPPVRRAQPPEEVEQHEAGIFPGPPDGAGLPAAGDDLHRGARRLRLRQHPPHLHGPARRAQLRARRQPADAAADEARARVDRRARARHRARPRLRRPASDEVPAGDGGGGRARRQGRAVEHLGRRARVLPREVRRDLRPRQAVRPDRGPRVRADRRGGQPGAGGRRAARGQPRATPG